MDKKELKQAYKNFKPDMGVYAYKCKHSGKAYLGYGQDIKGDINSITFRLNLGNFNSKCNLQNEWKQYREAGFEVVILETLKYEKDETKSDYTTDLCILRKLCSEKFDNYEFIQD